MIPKHYTGQAATSTTVVVTTVLDTVPNVSLEGPAVGTSERLHVTSLAIQTDSATDIDVQLQRVVFVGGAVQVLWRGLVMASAPIKLGDYEGDDNPDIGGSLASGDILQLVVPVTGAIQKVDFDIEGYLD